MRQFPCSLAFSVASLGAPRSAAGFVIGYHGLVALPKHGERRRRCRERNQGPRAARHSGMRLFLGAGPESNHHREYGFRARAKKEARPGMTGLVYSTASCLLRRSVTSIKPGAWVMANGSFAAAITACGVTPQAQNTGISSASTGTASP